MICLLWNEVNSSYMQATMRKRRANSQQIVISCPMNEWCERFWWLWGLLRQGAVVALLGGATPTKTERHPQNKVQYSMFSTNSCSFLSTLKKAMKYQRAVDQLNMLVDLLNQAGHISYKKRFHPDHQDTCRSNVKQTRNITQTGKMASFYAHNCSLMAQF